MVKGKRTESHRDRKLQRRHLIYYLRVFEQDSGRLIGHLVDLTAEGMMLISETALATDKVYALRMELPGEVFAHEQFDFTARSVWCRPDVNPKFFDIGLTLLNVEARDITCIEDLMQHYGFND